MGASENGIYEFWDILLRWIIIEDLESKHRVYLHKKKQINKEETNHNIL